MNSDNSKNSKPHVLIFNLTDKIDLQGREKSIASSNLSIYNPWKNYILSEMIDYPSNKNICE